MWPDYPCLYDVRSAVFKNRDVRKLAMDEIAGKLDQNEKHREVAVREKTQQKPSPTPTTDSETIVDAGDDILNDDTDDDTLSQDQPSAIEHTTPKSTQEPPKRRPKSARKQRDEEEYLHLKGLANSISQRESKKAKTKEESSEVDTFGLYIVDSLNKLEPMTRHIEHNISNILFQARMGMLGPSQHHMYPLQPQVGPPLPHLQQKQQQQQQPLQQKQLQQQQF
ncbi:hypothetical protein LSAT2_008797 [Lamellibrachia satsuma]|nr:hypothetical protein LSAT2_008797 [Lamellibrachia satsuma]